MQINIKLAASIAAGVTVAGATAHQIIRLRKTEALISEFNDSVDAYNAAMETVMSPTLKAFNQAQDVISDRMLSGYYDDCPDDVARHDFQILYNNFLTK